jgi:methionyl aminopeptidase
MALVKDPWELALMRQSGQRLAEVVALLKESVKAGTSSLELDALAEREIRKRGGIPSFKGYAVEPGVNFPATICASPNEQVVHGIPTEIELVDGDLISIDVGLSYGGYHSDCAFTVAIGAVSDDVRELLEVTERSLQEGIQHAVAGNRIGDIGYAIEKSIEPHGFGIVRDYVGHGIGRRLHERPSVPNYGTRRQGSLIKPGMCLAIEPMVTLGSEETEVLGDRWTVVTEDGSLAAHFEHTVVVTPRGPEIVTALKG